MNTAATGESQPAEAEDSNVKKGADKAAPASDPVSDPASDPASDDESAGAGWQLHSSHLSSDAQDPLVGCLVNLTKIFGSP